MNSLLEAGIAAGVAQNAEDLLHRDTQLEARNFFEEIEHVKKGPVIATGIPLGLTGTPGRSGPAGTLLGMTTEELRECREAGAIEIPDREAPRGK